MRGRGGRGGRGRSKHQHGHLETLLGHAHDSGNATAQFVNAAASADAGQEEFEFFQNLRIRGIIDAFTRVRTFREQSELSQEVPVVVKRLLEGALGGNVSRVRARFGRLVGTASRDTLNLPILSDAVLSKEDLCVGTQVVSMDHEFSSASQQLMSSHVTRILLARVQSLQTTGTAGLELENLETSEVIVEYYGDGVQVWKSPAGEVLSSRRVTELESVVIYRAMRSVHLQFVAESVQDVPLPTTEMLLAERRVTEKQILRDPDGGGVIEWEILTTQVDSLNMSENERTDSDTGFEFQFGLSDNTWNLLNQVSVCLMETGDDAQTAELESMISSLALSLLGNARVLSSFDDSDTSNEKLYYPNLFGDIVADTRKHYNLKKIGVATRSAIEIVRRSNNMAKRLLIDDWVASGASVLDLACGHGQDLLKYSKKDLKLFVGVDVSNEEIKEARQRYRKQQNGRFCGTTPPPCRFHVGNMLLPASYDKFLKPETMLDVVSVQLAIHYTLGTEENARLILSSIANHLKPGGIFIGTCPSCFTIHERMRRSLTRRITSEGDIDYAFGNKVYCVSFSRTEYEDLAGSSDTEANERSMEELQHIPVKLPGDPSLPPHPWLQEILQTRLERVPLGFDQRDVTTHSLVDDDPLLLQLNERWGIKYTFWLIDHIDAAEFVVPWRAFCRLARQFGLSCLLACPFDVYVEAMVQRGHVEAVDFKRRMETLIQDSTTAEEQGEVISFYQVFAFQKLMSQADRDANLPLAPSPPAFSAFTRTQMVSANWQQ
eukprot:Gregarina_sp_Poly_1__8156@NODE_471_length_8141_cov_141_032821_g382_i0_p2_GENE_NODE_471_length_8141_cov_141_032821_g382_i0NODE_471_length_8141_cov_141_032821_g382_i0_p2_ORF_typecomplete_len775_score132_62Pox_MCEL/PF03291_16/1_8e57Methyltransf_31/PF13847_6/1_5e11Methyltransf_25/PF13649_6/1_1e10Methyltransf_25/PF13649_6/2_3e03Methyltransf_23/PF13489_6/6_4e10Methyltransf_11/PF08241_12/2_9e08Ubie_methyltran/PF01209_18/5_8e07Ubie_methyltran/PF01209_18/1_9e03Methyltransf_20/PF12147_8/1_7e06MetW/PF07021